MKKFIKKWLFKFKYPKCNINTVQIHKGAILGKGVNLAKGVNIGENVIIGDNSYVNDYTDISSAVIGKFCSIAGCCGIWLNNHPISWISTSPVLYTLIGMTSSERYSENKKPPVIGNDVWIGMHSVILKGIQIGDGAIVAAGSVVTKDIPPYAIVAGVPAKVIKYRFERDIIEKLLQLKWWDKKDTELIALKSIIKKQNKFTEELIN